jgi:hypothetical protein
MKKLLILVLTLALLITPVLAAEDVSEEIKKSLEHIDMGDSLDKAGFFLPILIEFKTTDLEESYFVELSQTSLQLTDSGDPHLVIEGTSEQIKNSFDSEGQTDLGSSFSDLEFQPRKFKGSVITVGFEKAYSKDLIVSPTFGQKILRVIMGFFV